MRRGSKILRSSFVYLILAAVFNLSSFSLDQFVWAKMEDKLVFTWRKTVNESWATTKILPTLREAIKIQKS